MAKQVLRVCDVCAKTPVRRYGIIAKGRTVHLELCPEHAAPIESLIGKAPNREGSIVARKVMTMEELERLKQLGQA